MRIHIFFRDFGICAECGMVHLYLNSEWEADHIRPLFTAYGDASFWEPENMRILCYDCHKIKTREDRWRYPRIRDPLKRRKKFGEPSEDS